MGEPFIYFEISVYFILFVKTIILKKVFSVIIIVAIYTNGCGQPIEERVNNVSEIKNTPSKKSIENSNIPDYVLRFIKTYYQREYKGTKVDFSDSDTALEMLFSNIPTSNDDYDGFLIDVYIPKKEKIELYGAAILFGDVDDDKLDDLIVGVHTEGGGTGGNGLHSTDLFVFLNNKGVYEFISMTPDREVAVNRKNGEGVFIPDKIQDGLLIGKSLLYQNDDPTCCPSLEQETKAKFSNNKLVFESKGKTRKIVYNNQ